MSREVLKQYERQLAVGALKADTAQRLGALRLQQLDDDLEAWQASRSGLLSMLLKSRAAPPMGVYLHGGVGRGKTMLMDLFFEATTFAPKRRVHFHEFMADVHDRIQRGRVTTDGDPIPYVATEIGAEAALLCFDELTITDIADAMIVSRLFKRLFERGLVLVATSNAAPERLYPDGLNRQLFLPFIGLVAEHMDVIELKAAKDFRLDKLSGRQLYLTPCDAAAKAAVDDHWHRLVGHRSGSPATLEVKGRSVHVPQAAMGVARFTFDDLCERPLGALDYLHIAHAFHTVIVEGIPVLGPDRRNAARRFIHLIDALYDNRVCLIVSAEAEPDHIYPAGDGAVLFERTASRLIEMRSEAYLAERARR